MEPFKLKVHLDGTKYLFDVYPGEDSTFAIGLDAEDIGILKKDILNDSWNWIEGGINEASLIGNKIDCHYE